MKTVTMFTSDDGELSSENEMDVLRYELKVAEQKISDMKFLLVDADYLLADATFPFTGDMLNGTGFDYEHSRDGWRRNYAAFMGEVPA